MATSEAIVRLLVYATIWIAMLIAAAAIMRVFWMWLFGAAAIVQELQSLRSEVRALQHQLQHEAAPQQPSSAAPSPSQKPASGRVSNTGWGED